ncbi:MAG: [FeFe] hydrogenase H-cluster radical SAM maturase HydE [Candidatus Omnitrophica bacterium]|nr:[FeFe] hydrogenase H-cluster radical SAM maturase HydE [Candidatus Omnitrophota bacterium]MDD5487720.1 [FeFe] hydrogenase H-cluster radical SAM maturase HydE [Candidatus Omnitrophota bacterium]
MKEIYISDEVRAPGDAYAFEDILAVLLSEDEEALRVIYDQADRMRSRHVGEGVHLRGLVEFSNNCSAVCSFCGINALNRGARRYRMTPDEIYGSAAFATGLGYRTIVLQSGEDALYGTDDICRIVERLRTRYGVAVTLSLGERTGPEYERLRGAGADRYLMRFETSDSALYSKLKPGSSLEKRLEHIRRIRDAGFQTGSGIMVGIPGQSVESIARDIMLFRQLDLDMVGSGPFVPHPDTGMGQGPAGSLSLVMKVTALTRIVLPGAHIPATTATGSIDPCGQEMALRVGANVLMPNMTPPGYREKYAIYPGKMCVKESPADSDRTARALISRIGRHVAEGYGHGRSYYLREKGKNG